MAADESRLKEWMQLACSTEGLSLCPEAAACLDVLHRALCEGRIGRDETVVLFNTAAAQKYVEVMQTELARIDHTRPIDWDSLA